MEYLEVYIPSDRRRAIARGETLPHRAYGTVLFADISGFTPLTEALVKELGPRQGVDELTQQLNQVYDALITEVEQFGGSVIFFSGDAITCWFEEKDEGGKMKAEKTSSFQAVACALQMQQVMQPFAAVTTPSGVEVSVAIKVAIAAGPVRRFLVGDPHIQRLDVLAGQTLDRMARSEHLAQKGEILVGPEIMAPLEGQLQVVEWRYEAESEERFAVISGLTNSSTFHPSNLPPPQLFNPPLTEAQIRPWLQLPVYERLKAGGGRFLAELRSAVALFISFHGLDYDHDDAAGDKLDAYIRWVQAILSRYEGGILQLTIGDKGSYLYISFGAPVAHDDDTSRAIAAALELRDPPLDFITATHIGLSQGRMRVGAYGSQTRRTYGVLGSEANIAARLMSRARPGQILASKHVAEAAAKVFSFIYLETTPVKGRTDPVPIFEVAGRQTAPIPSSASENILLELDQILEAVLSGQGQVAWLDETQDLSRERLLPMLREQAAGRGFQIIGGMPTQNSIYSPWRELFRARFELADTPQFRENELTWTTYQINQVEAAITHLNPDWLPLLPLLGDLLGLPIPDNDTTTIFNPLLRQGTLFALVMEIVKTWAMAQPILLIIEQAPRLPELAQRLTLALARTLTNMPLLLLLTHQPPPDPPGQFLPDLSRLSYYHHLAAENSPIIASQSHSWRLSGASTFSAASMIGRSAERLRLTGHLQALLHGNSGGAVLIEGEAGIGKSRLVADLLQQAQVAGVTCLMGGGEAIEQSTPYHAWQPLFRQLFKLAARPTADIAAQQTHVLSFLSASPELLRLAPLLNAVLPLALPENDLTRQMTGQVRADNTRELLLNLLQNAATPAPALLVLEDAHWLDSASWALTRLVSQRVPRALLIIATRPLALPLPVEYTQLLQSPGLQQLKLEALSPEETLTLVCQRLGVKTLPDPVMALIRAKAEGHPFFSEELAYALRDAGLIQIVAGECKLVAEASDFGAITLPNTVEEVITSRIDRLSPPQQLILKIASVIGRTFSANLLRDIHPNQAEKRYLPGHLEALTRLDITRLDAPEPGLVYTFKHAIIREVAYNLMLFDQRQELHRAVAEWVEHTYTKDLLPYYSLLAHHWSHVVGSRPGNAIFVTKALEYLEKAGEQALRGYANQEAVRFLGEAVAISGGYFDRPAQREQPSSAPLFPSPPAQLRRARWERQLGEAYLGLGQLAESREHLGRAVELLGWPQPDQRVKHVTGVLGQVARQISHRLWPIGLKQKNPERRAVLLEATRTYERLGEVHYWSNQTLPAIYAALRTLNLAEQAGPSPELARAYANMSLVAGFASLGGLAQTYSRRAQTAAEIARHQPALAWVLELTGVYALGVGNWPAARAALAQGAQIAHQLEDRRRWEECTTALGDITFFQGNFDEALKLWAEVYLSARRRGDFQAQSWGLAGQLRSLSALGQLETAPAQTALQALTEVVREDIGSADKINSYGIIALSYWRQGQPEAAQKALEAGLHWIAQSSPTGFGVIHGYTNIAELSLALYEAKEILDSEWPVLDLADQNPKLNAEQSCQLLHRYSRAFPIGQPRAWLWQGVYYWLSKEAGRAYTTWRKSLTTAERLGMPYEQALALYQLGCHLPSDDPNRRIHLNHAAEIFTQLEAKGDLNRVKQML